MSMIVKERIPSSSSATRRRRNSSAATTRSARTVVVVSSGDERRVVGVVADVRQAGLEVSRVPRCTFQWPRPGANPTASSSCDTTGDPNDALPALRAVVSQVLARQPLRQIARLDDLVAAQTPSVG